MVQLNTGKATGGSYQVSHAAVIITDDEFRRFAVLKAPDGVGFTIPIYEVHPDRFCGDVQWNARTSFKEGTGVNHEAGVWRPSGITNISELGRVEVYVVEFIQKISLPDDYTWLSCREFVNQTLTVQLADPLVQRSHALASVAITTLSTDIRFWKAHTN